MNSEQKQKLKNLLLDYSSDEEKQEIEELDIAQNLKSLETVSSQSNAELRKALEKTVNRITERNQKIYDNLVTVFAEKIEQLGGTITTFYEKNRPVNATPVYKDMINQLSTINTSIQKKPVPVWNWPQYAAINVRDKNFRNIDPAQGFQDTSTTPSTPYVALLGYDNAGTVSRVTNAVGLPVNVVTGTISISSPGISGLSVNLSKIGNFAVSPQVSGVATSALSGVKINVSQLTIVTSSLSGLQASITKVTTSAFSGIKINVDRVVTASFAGIKTFVENLATSSLAGLQTDLRKIGGTVFSLGQAVMASSLPVAIASNQSNLPVNIAAATTSVLSGVNVAVERFTASTSSLSGLQFDLRKIGGNTIATAATGIAKFGLTDGSGTTITSTGSALDINIKTPATLPVSISGNQAVNIAQIAGTTTSVNNGTTDAGTLRVTISSDSTGQIKLATGSNTIGALTANQSVNVAQIAGSNTATSATGVQKVGITSSTGVALDKTLTNTALLVTTSGSGLIITTTVGGIRLATGANTIGALSANQSVNINQISGSAVSTVATGTQKVGITSSTGSALDKTLTNTALLITTSGSGLIITTTIGGIRLATGSNTIGALSANQSVNVAQIAGTTTSVNNGTTDAGTIRVTVSSDSTGQVKLATGANTIGALTANQSVNVAQIAGSNTVTSATGIQKVGISGATGSTLDRTLTNTALFITSSAPGLSITPVSTASFSGINVNMGLAGNARTTNPTAQSNGARTSAILDKLGKMITVGAIRELKSTYNTGIVASTLETTFISSQGAGIFLDLYGVLVTNTSSTGTYVRFRDTTGGKERFQIYCPATDTRGFMLPVDSAIRQTTANSNWTAVSSASVTTLWISGFFVQNT